MDGRITHFGQSLFLNQLNPSFVLGYWHAVINKAISHQFCGLQCLKMQTCAKFGEQISHTN